jgi:hypothetical protein
VQPLSAPDPYEFRSIWGIRAKDLRGFDLLVARQLLWLPHARPAVRKLLFTAKEQPLCPACGQVVGTGSMAVVCMALLADRELVDLLSRDPTLVVAREPDGREAWWITHGDCIDQLTAARTAELNERIELALRDDTRRN